MPETPVEKAGLAAEELRVRVAARNIANISTPGYVQQRVEQTSIGQSSGVATAVGPVKIGYLPEAESNVDLVGQVATLVQAKAAYEANLAVIVTVDQMTKGLLDILDYQARDRV
jgi:flagellar basal body rod protein FlgG